MRALEDNEIRVRAPYCMPIMGRFALFSAVSHLRFACLGDLVLSAGDGEVVNLIKAAIQAAQKRARSRHCI